MLRGDELTGDINYAPIIKDMVWSHSRIKTFDDCPYRFYLKYIRRLHGGDMFFASYGTFMHKLIELYYTEHKSSQELCDMYLQRFQTEVSDRAPNAKVFGNYFRSGLQYLKHIQPLPYNVMAVEKRVDFNLSGVPFVGIIDLLGERDGEIYIVDNKSRTLKPRSKRVKPTKTDCELDDYLRQLYLYAVAVEQEYGRVPKFLCFNCFRVPAIIKEPFAERAYSEAQQWLLDKIEVIAKETDFHPDVEYFKCTYLCEMNEFCDYYRLSQKG